MFSKIQAKYFLYPNPEQSKIHVRYYTPTLYGCLWKIRENSQKQKGRIGRREGTFILFSFPISFPLCKLKKLLLGKSIADNRELHISLCLRFVSKRFTSFQRTLDSAIRQEWLHTEYHITQRCRFMTTKRRRLGELYLNVSSYVHCFAFGKNWISLICLVQ